MKQGWEIKKLGDITTSINGLWTGKKPPFITIAVIRNTNFTKDCKLDTSDIAYIDVEVKQYASRKLQCGDIIIEKSGGSDKQPVGRPILFNIEEGEYSFSNFTSTLRVSDKTTILPEFIHRCLAYIYMRGDTAAMQSKTTGIRNLDFNLYKSINIPIPPREEQERIVEELDCLSGVIERKREQLQQLDALAQSIFYQMFGDPITNEKGWDVKKWGDLFDTILGKMLDKKKQVETDVVLPYIANTNVQWGYFILDDLKTMTFSNKERIKLKLELGDILICEGGESGRCAVWNGANEEILFQKAIHRARVKNGSTIMPMFVSILLKEIKLNGGLKDYISKSTIEHLTGEKLNLVPIICPPLILQQEFANKIEAIEKQKELIKQSITQTEDLFNSRMDYYFN